MRLSRALSRELRYRFRKQEDVGAMTFASLLGALRRRWYIVIAGVLHTAGLCYGVYSIVPAEYNARGLIVLIPSVPEDEPGGNPLLGLASLDLPARVLVASYSSNAAQEDIAERAPDAEVIVSIEESTRGPVIAVDVTDSSPESALSILSYVAGSIPETLATLQSEVNVPERAVVRSMPLTMDTEAEPNYETLTRLLILAAAGGLALTVLAAYALDGVLSRRGRRRTPAGPSEPIVEDEEPPYASDDPDIASLALLRQHLPAEPKLASSRRDSAGSSRQ